jgi:hypothetical protein
MLELMRKKSLKSVIKCNKVFKSVQLCILQKPIKSESIFEEQIGNKNNENTANQRKNKINKNRCKRYFTAV